MFTEQVDVISFNIANLILILADWALRAPTIFLRCSNNQDLQIPLRGTIMQSLLSSYNYGFAILLRPTELLLVVAQNDKTCGFGKVTVRDLFLLTSLNFHELVYP